MMRKMKFLQHITTCNRSYSIIW